MDNPPNSPAYKKADAKLKKITARQKEETPIERHRLRLSSLYVEPNEDGTAWERPQQQTKEDAERELSHAVWDYAGVYDRLVLGNAVPSNMLTAFQAW